MEYNYVMCLADVDILLYLTTMVDNCIPRQQLGSCSMTRPFLCKGCGLRDYYTARLHLLLSFQPSRSEFTLTFSTQTLSNAELISFADASM